MQNPSRASGLGPALTCNTMTRPSVEPWLASAALERVGEFATQLRTVGDTSVRVPNLDWTVADLAQHVASLPSHFGRLQDDAAGFVRPTDWAAFADERRAHITETDAAKLADFIDTELSTYVQLLTESERRWLYGSEFDTTILMGLFLDELIIHGMDLAGATGADAPVFEENEANAAAEAAVITTPLFIDPVKAAAQPDGVYHLKFRGGRHFTWTKTGNGLVTTEGKPAKADAHLNTDPAMFMLSSLGRVSQVRAALSGKMVSYGRKPWRFIGLGGMVFDGI